MPTESSVVASLIRDMNTHRLPSEPSDAVLFQPAPGAQPKPATRAHAAGPSRFSPKPAANVVARTAAKSPTSAWKGWLQLTFVTLLVGGWAYFAAQLDPYGESSAPAALPLPLPAVSATPIAAPAPVIPAAPSAAQPAAAAIASPAQPATETSTSEPRPAAAPATAEAQPSVGATSIAETSVVETPVAEAAAPPSHASKKHRRHGSSKAKPKRVAKTKVASDAAEQPAAAPEPAAKPEPAIPAKPAAPSKPRQQSDDSENPLK